MQLSYSTKQTVCNIVMWRPHVRSFQSGRATWGRKLHLQPQPQKRRLHLDVKAQERLCISENLNWVGMRSCPALSDIFPQLFEKVHQKTDLKILSLSGKKKKKNTLWIQKVDINILRLPVKKWQQSIQLIPQLWKTNKQQSLSCILACEYSQIIFSSENNSR